MRLREVLRRSEVLLPVTVADESNGRRALFVIALDEIAADGRMNVEDREKLGRHCCHFGARRLRGSGDRNSVSCVLRDGLEALVLIAEVVEIWVSESRQPAV